MKRCLAVALVCVMTMAVTASANLVLVDATNDVYKTTTGGQTLYWYLKYDETTNKTLAEQEALAANLSLGIGADDWHLATESEITELMAPLGFADTTQATLLGNTLQDLGYTIGDNNSYYTGKFSGRYDEEASYGGYTLIAQISENLFSPPPDVFSPSFGYANDGIIGGPTGRYDDLGAWIVATPEPATICLLGLGGLLLRRRKKA